MRRHRARHPARRPARLARLAVGRVTGSRHRVRAGAVRAVRRPRVEGRRALGQSMEVPSIAVTGVSGLVGQALVTRLAQESGVTRIVGLDVREPRRRTRALEFHLIDVARAELKPVLEGIDVLVHLASVVDPIPDEAMMARVNVEGTRRVLDAAGAVGVGKVVRVSSAAVYGAWPNNPVPLTEQAPLRPNPGFSPAVQAAEAERLLAEWRADHPAATVTTLRGGAGSRTGRRTPAVPVAPGPPRAARPQGDAAGAGRARRRPGRSPRARRAGRPPGRVQRGRRRVAQLRRRPRPASRARSCPRSRRSCCSASCAAPGPRGWGRSLPASSRISSTLG